jgi:hypothetical protein
MNTQATDVVLPAPPASASALRRARPQPDPRLVFQFALSTAFNVTVLLLLALALRPAVPIIADAPVTVIELVRPERSVPLPAKTERASRAARSRSAYVDTRSQVLQAPAPMENQPSAPRLAEAPEGSELAAAAHALRTSIGCDNPDLSRLTPEERETCRHRKADITRDVPTYALGASSPGKAEGLRRAAHCADVWKAYRDSTRMDDFPGGNCAKPGEH